MLKSYEAVYEDGQLTWIAEQPPAHAVRVIVTVVEELEPTSAGKPNESEFIQTFQGVMEKRRSAYEDLA
ncbi:MAG: hypothetical protein AAF171_23160 [Cyanobacteria bacterium P01_A01_bin.116]